MMATHIADLHFERPGPRFSLWYGILVGPIALAADQQISYALVAHACSTQHFYLLHVITLVALLFAISGTLIGALNLARTRRAAVDGPRPVDRSRFMSMIGIAASIGWSIVIIAMAVPRFILSPCD
jgi:hypothetical protein